MPPPTGALVSSFASYEGELVEALLECLDKELHPRLIALVDEEVAPYPLAFARRSGTRTSSAGGAEEAENMISMDEDEEEKSLNPRSDPYRDFRAASDPSLLTPECRVPFSHASLGWYETMLGRHNYIHFRSTVGFHFFVQERFANNIARNTKRTRYYAERTTRTSAEKTSSDEMLKTSTRMNSIPNNSTENTTTTKTKRLSTRSAGADSPFYPLDSFACVMTTPLHSRTLDVDVPRNFVRTWFLNPDAAIAAQEAEAVMRRFEDSQGTKKRDLGTKNLLEALRDVTRAADRARSEAETTKKRFREVSEAVISSASEDDGSWLWRRTEALLDKLKSDTGYAAGEMEHLSKEWTKWLGEGGNAEIRVDSRPGASVVHADFGVAAGTISGPL